MTPPLEQGCKKSCRGCANWGPECVADLGKDLKAWAICHGNPYVRAYTSQIDGERCDWFTPRVGEPLGTGVTRYWFWQDSFLDPASIIHDFHYQMLPAGMTFRQRDQKWLKNSLKLCGWNPAKMLVALNGYTVIRSYSKISSSSGEGII